MHAVILKESGIKPATQSIDGLKQKVELYICCHLRRIENGEIENS